PEDKPAPSSPVFSSKATYGGFGGKESLGLGAVPTSFDELMGVPKPEPSPAPVTSSSFSMPQTSVTPSVSAASHAAFGTDEATISSLEAKLAAARVAFEEKFHQPAPKPPIISSVPIPDLSAKPNPITSLTSDVSAVAKTDSIASLKPEASASLKHEPKSDPVKETVSEPASSLPPDAIQVMVNGETIVLSGKKEYVYVDAFTVYEFDLSNPKGKSVETLLNGQKAEYTAPLKNGDDIRIFWKD
ncbi:MAG: hypothetical protein K6G07_07155, partial [Lachnospiraceae bacterium]|nr:hypothetical protein [Lachnospiraceae bacterium]